MLRAVIKKKNIDQYEVIYFEFPITLIERDDAVFTDASANTDAPPNFYTDPGDLVKLNWTEIDSRKWGSPIETLRHQRMAEVLIHSQLSVQEAKSVVVWNEGIKKHVQEIVKKAGVPFPPIILEDPARRHYFVNFTDAAEKGRSIVTGPRGIASRYIKACQETADGINKTQSALFENVTNLLRGLRDDFSCLPETAELVGLQSENGIHKETVDVHTLHVVEQLSSLPEFTSLEPQFQDMVQLSAFLHDIGKGPKSRWASNGGLQKVDPDHAVRALPMIVKILTQHVQQVEQQTAETLLKLVCYHDLVGEVLGKDRDEQQIIDVAKSKSELDMLFALGKADATSLVEWWWNEKKAAALYDRCLAGIHA